MIGSVNYSTYVIDNMIQALDRKIYIGGAWQDYNGGYVFKSGYVSSNICIINPTISGPVNKWLAFTKSDSLNGGNINYEFASSSNKGITWSSWTPLADVNLKNVPCQENGNDLIRLRVTLYSPDHNTTPQINSITLNYDSGYRTSLDNVIIVPNPFRPDSINNTITFYNLTADAVINVYSITGRLITTLKPTINKCVWDTRDNHGKLLPAGMYTCYISNSQSQKKYLQLMIKH